MSEREMPRNLPAECALLHALLVESTAFDRVAPIVTASDFSPQHRPLYGAIAAMEGRGVEVLTVANWLREHGKLEDVGGIAGIAALLDGNPDIAQVETYARMVRDASVRREVILGCQRLQASAFNGEPVEEIAASGAGLFSNVARVQSSGVVTVRALAHQALQRLESRIVAGEWMTGVSTGITALDAYTLGYQRGVQSVLGARPRVGKTAKAITTAVNALRRGERVVFFELDMSQAMFGDRLLAHLSGVDSYKIRSGVGLDDEELGRVNGAAREMYEWGDRWVIDHETRDVALLAAHARRQARKGLDLLIVDHIGHIRGGKGEARHLQLGDVSSRLIEIAGETNAAVLTLVQLKRESEDREPELSDLAESGKLEQDARLVVLIDRPHFRFGEGYCPKCDGVGRKGGVCPVCCGAGKVTQCLTLLKVPKNEGEAGAKFPVHFDLKRQRVTERPEHSCGYCSVRGIV